MSALLEGSLITSMICSWLCGTGTLSISHVSELCALIFKLVELHVLVFIPRFATFAIFS